MAEESVILIVDDNAENLDLLSEVLSRAGYRVRPALSGEMALKAISTGMLPDLILLDIRMPGMDGYEVCKKLKLNEDARDIPVIFISGMHYSSERINAFEVGGVDYVSKPFCEEEVLARVRTHISLYHSKRHLEETVAIRTRELTESEAHLRQLSVYLQKVREEDRASFSRELHDELGQNLTALRIDINELANQMTGMDASVISRLATIDHAVNVTIDSMRRICEKMRPSMLDDLGLEVALMNYTKRFTKQFGVPCDLALDCEDYGLDDSISIAIYRIVQESLTNIARHARASHAFVALQDSDDHLLLTIADDGCGMLNEVTEGRPTYGLLGMRERVILLGGSLEIDSEAGRGTHIEVTIPRSQGAS